MVGCSGPLPQTGRGMSGALTLTLKELVEAVKAFKYHPVVFYADLVNRIYLRLVRFTHSQLTWLDFHRNPQRTFTHTMRSGRV